MKMEVICSMLAATLLLPALAVESNKVSKAESEHIVAIAKDGMLEVRLGEVASKNATNPAVKDFGTHMTTDHGKANDTLKAAAQKEGVTLPSDLDNGQKNKEKSLSSVKGAEFDKKYVNEMVAGHHKAVDALTKEAKTGTGEFKKWAEETLPTVKNHLKMAEDLKSKLKA